MDWFLYDIGLRQEGVKLKISGGRNDSLKVLSKYQEVNNKHS